MQTHRFRKVSSIWIPPFRSIVRHLKRIRQCSACTINSAANLACIAYARVGGKSKREFEQELALAPSNADAEYEIGEICPRKSSARGGNQPTSNVRSATILNLWKRGWASRRRFWSWDITADALPHLQEAERLDPENKSRITCWLRPTRVWAIPMRPPENLQCTGSLGQVPRLSCQQSSSSDQQLNEEQFIFSSEKGM